MMSHLTDVSHDLPASGEDASFPSTHTVRRKTPPIKQKILVIEDDKSMHALYKAILKDPTYTFMSAYDGTAGLVIAQAIGADLILLDVDLPDVTGFFICKYLKMNSLTASIPVIFISALSSAEDMICGLELDASDYVTKPFEENDLRDRVDGALRERRTIDQIAAACPVVRPHSPAPWSAHLPSHFGSVRRQLVDTQIKNPWTRIGRVVDVLMDRLNKARKRLK